MDRVDKNTMQIRLLEQVLQLFPAWVPALPLDILDLSRFDN